MIIWLASYPRSGNTMLRTMLNRVFGLPSYSLYDDRDDIGAVPAVADAVGHRFQPASWPAFYERSRRSADIVAIKTHHPPFDDSKAIYIVRDGRAAIVSWYNMLRNLRRRDDIEISDIIRGEKVVYGDWSTHIAHWRPLERPATLLLRYESLLAEPRSNIDRIANFLGAPPLRSWDNLFGEMHSAMPQFFAAADNRKNIAQMTSDDLALFWRLHGATMTALGYGAESSGSSPA